MTKKDLQDQLTRAMLDRDELKKSVLRMLISAVTYFEIQKAVPAGRQGGAGYVATEADIIAVIQSQIKQRKDSIEQFAAGGRDELVQKETAELEVLQAYLPAQLSPEELAALVTEAITQTGATTPADMGKVMGYLSPQIKGRADGALVSQMVRDSLKS